MVGLPKKYTTLCTLYPPPKAFRILISSGGRVKGENNNMEVTAYFPFYAPDNLIPIYASSLIFI